jgi:hypothetical protein
VARVPVFSSLQRDFHSSLATREFNDYVSNSKSGSFFFFTKNMHYMVSHELECCSLGLRLA